VKIHIDPKFEMNVDCFKTYSDQFKSLIHWGHDGDSGLLVPYSKVG